MFRAGPSLNKVAIALWLLLGLIQMTWCFTKEEIIKDYKNLLDFYHAELGRAKNTLARTRVEESRSCLDDCIDSLRAMPPRGACELAGTSGDWKVTIQSMETQYRLLAGAHKGIKNMLGFYSLEHAQWTANLKAMKDGHAQSAHLSLPMDVYPILSGVINGISGLECTLSWLKERIYYLNRLGVSLQTPYSSESFKSVSNMIAGFLVPFPSLSEGYEYAPCRNLLLDYRRTGRVTQRTAGDKYAPYPSTTQSTPSPIAPLNPPTEPRCSPTGPNASQAGMSPANPLPNRRRRPQRSSRSRYTAVFEVDRPSYHPPSCQFTMDPSLNFSFFITPPHQKPGPASGPPFVQTIKVLTPESYEERNSSV